MDKHILALILIVATILGTSLTITVQAIREDLAKYRTESECIARAISVGVERRDIATKDGKCWVETDNVGQTLQDIRGELLAGERTTIDHGREAN